MWRFRVNQVALRLVFVLHRIGHNSPGFVSGASHFAAVCANDRL